MAWPPNWNLNAARQNANWATQFGRVDVLEDWAANYVTPWGKGVDKKIQDLENGQAGHGKRIKNLEEQGMFWRAEWANVEKRCRKNGQDVNNLDKKMNQALEGIEELPEKLGQQRGGLGGGFGGGGYNNSQNAYQQGFIMIPQQQQLVPVMPWGAPTPALAPAPAPSCGCRVYESTRIHIGKSPRSSRRYKIYL
ncbi:hypothetical protein NA56DRAFT_688760 [Hyaloscypha hepaticicola]|uniref:Uncharacterized protein n=1 Tax=Hyaloscypha hepaticicola TaxID=2082293 RepID=A0A2J6Q5I7_9HELO|nr:hypothetical protein NA56DRAFT_688760 [Hyaloscypha hepaticicola]